MVEKIKNFLTSKSAKIASASAVGLTAVSSVGFMADGDTPTTGSIPDLTPIMNALTNSLTPENLIAMIASVIGYAMPFVLMWFGYRFLRRAFTKAVMAGRL